MRNQKMLSYSFNNFVLEQYARDGVWLVAESDSGGIFLLAVPVLAIKASDNVVLQLLADLELLGWNSARLSEQSQPSDEVNIWIIEGVENPLADTPMDQKHSRKFNNFWISCDFIDVGQPFSYIASQVAQLLAGNITRLSLNDELMTKPELCDGRGGKGGYQAGRNTHQRS